MKQFLIRNHKQVFFLTWLFLNLIQATATELFDDEAYYWVYSNFLDYGYFDHPAMIAILIKLGYYLIPTELGLRLLILLMSTATLWMIEKLLKEKDDPLFYCIAISMGILQIGGIIAVPDIPLLFFSTLFFLLYRRLLEKKNISNSIFLGVCIALMCYSKYHGVLIVLFTIASNPRLLTSYHIYLAGLVSLILFFPHLYWQYRNDFPSVQYHLFERNPTSYSFSYTTDYILVQLLVLGPLAGIPLLWATVKKRPADLTEKALRTTTIGILLFFLLTTLKGRVEANWTFPAITGIIVLSHQYIFFNNRMRRLMFYMAALTLPLVLVCRIFMVGGIPTFWVKSEEILGNKEWVNSIRTKANGLPVFFSDSYQFASKYWFYTGQPTFSLNSVYYRRNNYNYWPIDDSFLGQKAFNVYKGRYKEFYRDSLMTSKGRFYTAVIPQYFSFQSIRVNCKSELKGKKDEQLSITLDIRTNQDMLARSDKGYDTAHIWIAIFENMKDPPFRLMTNLTLADIKSEKQQLLAKIQLSIPPGEYVARFGITSCIENWPGLNSSTTRMKVE